MAVDALARTLLTNNCDSSVSSQTVAAARVQADMWRSRRPQRQEEHNAHGRDGGDEEERWCSHRSGQCQRGADGWPHEAGGGDQGGGERFQERQTSERRSGPRRSRRSKRDSYIQAGCLSAELNSQHPIQLGIELRVQIACLDIRISLSRARIFWNHFAGWSSALSKSISSSLSSTIHFVWPSLCPALTLAVSIAVTPFLPRPPGLYRAPCSPCGLGPCEPHQSLLSPLV